MWPTVKYWWHQHSFHWKSANFAISRNINIDWILTHNFFLFFSLFFSIYFNRKFYWEKVATWVFLNLLVLLIKRNYLSLHLIASRESKVPKVGSRVSNTKLVVIYAATWATYKAKLKIIKKIRPKINFYISGNETFKP